MLNTHLEAIFEAARKGPETLSQRDTAALAGEIYRLFIAKFEENPGTPDRWAAVKGFNRAVGEGRLLHAPSLLPEAIDTNRQLAQSLGPDFTSAINEAPQAPDGVLEALEKRFGWLTDWVLTSHGRNIDRESRDRLLRAVEQASTLAAKALKRFADGDYTPDEAAKRFPPVVPKEVAQATQQPSMTFESLFTAYSRVPGKFGFRRDKTLRDYEAIVVREFASFIKQRASHSDPSRVTHGDVVAWRDDLLARGIQAKTIKAKKLCAVRAVYGRAERDGILSHNPAEHVEMLVAKKPSEREKGFTDTETPTILKAAWSFQPRRHHPATAAAHRWVPWLGAYTGARVTEMTQLRGCDVFLQGNSWVVRFTPEAGGIKTNQYRDVPLHPHLLELGFISFVQASGDGPLFYKPDQTGQVSLSKAQGVARTLSDWVRKEVGISDKRVSPNHGWRHRFISQARKMRMNEEHRKAIVGHALTGAAEGYGDIPELMMEIEQIPKIDVLDAPPEASRSLPQPSNATKTPPQTLPKPLR